MFTSMFMNIEKQTISVYVRDFVHNNSITIGRSSDKGGTKEMGREQVALSIFQLLRLSCESTCPMEFATAKWCRLSNDNTELCMDVSTPIINDIIVVEADPFDLMHQTVNQIYLINNSGPTNAIISTTDHCVYSIDVRVSNLILSPSQDCKAVSALPDTSNYFRLDKCKPRQTHNQWDFIKIKS
jgi:hypothetical protein